MTDYERQDLNFLLQALRIEAHNFKKSRPDYAKMLFEKLDRVQPIVNNQLEI